MIKECFREAHKEEAEEILNFYRSFIGTEGCTWSQEYPGEEHVAMDIRQGNLFLVKDEKGIAATISIDSDEQVDALPNWTVENAREAARLAVRKDMQNGGVAREMLLCLMEELKRRGYQGIHFLVSPGNPAALASYAKLRFENRGEISMYDHTWFCYEKRI
ncbi:MAG: GNAT family N-acetyltransferase [Lachnospiraceae bacterium]|nr:GNAT family N-acetyltransferase [Lachnospiraceae bacterium]